MAAVANTSTGPRNVLHKTDKVASLLANPRHHLIRRASSQENIGRQQRDDCVQDYSPCSCKVYSVNRISVYCQNVSVETVRDVFQRVNDTEISKFEFYPLANVTNTVSLPPDFLSNTRVTGKIEIEGDIGNAKYPNLVIDPLAFRASQKSLTKEFMVSKVDLALQKDFDFLHGFNKLKELTLFNPINFTAFQFLPTLRSLKKLSVRYCPDLNRIPFPDLSPAKLKELVLSNNDLNDQKANEIVAKLAASASADSLEVLNLSENSLTRNPSRVRLAFPKLKNINLYENNFPSRIPSFLTDAVEKIFAFTQVSAFFLAFGPLGRIIAPITELVDRSSERNINRRRRKYCAQYNSTCSCFANENNQIYLSCTGVSVKSIRDVFQRVNEPKIYSLRWMEPLPDTTKTISLPADILGNKRVASVIHIKGNAKYPNLVIDPFSFRSSQKSLAKEFRVSNVDFGWQKDFNFLNGFNKLEELTFSQITNLTAFQYLPPLPSIQKLTVRYCPSELNQIPFPDLRSAKLKDLELWENEISDEKADEIVAKLAASTSAESLEALRLESNSLTRIPSQLGSAFPKLKRLNLNNNKISNITSSSFTFVSRYLEELYLSENGIKTIESGAFQGKSTFSNLFFGLTNRRNNNTRSIFGFPRKFRKD